MAVKDAHITVKDLTLAYGSYVVQQKLNFTINRGEVLIIMGGCGKSTIMYGLTGLKAPATGQVLYDDISFWESTPEEKERIRQSIGVMFQSGALWSSMTLAENVSLPLEQYTKLNRSQIHKLVSLKLALVVQWALLEAEEDELIIMRRSKYQEPAADNTYKGLVLAKSRTIEKLSLDVAATVKKALANKR